MTENCLNCGHKLADGDIFCALCGQKHSKKSGTVREFLVDFLGDYFTFDSKIFRSLIPLVLKPGFLTTEYLNGKRVSYIPPLRLYIFISIIFFIIFKISNPFSGSVVDKENIMSQDMIDYYVDHHLHKVFFLLLPLFAFIIYLFYKKTEKNFLTHFIFSLHFHSFLFILLSSYVLITTYLTAKWYSFNNWLFVAVTLCFILYLYKSLSKVFKERSIKVILKVVGISFTYAILFLTSSILALNLYYHMKS